MEKYFYVEIEEDISRTLSPFIVEHQEIMLAASEEMIIADLLHRFGKHLVTFSIDEIAEDDERMKSARIYVVPLREG